MNSHPSRQTLIRAGGGFSALGCVAFGIAALRAPVRVGHRCGLDVDATRLAGARDLIFGGLLLARPSAGAFGARAAIDGADALLLARRRPLIGATAGAYAVLNALLALAHRGGP